MPAVPVDFPALTPLATQAPPTVRAPAPEGDPAPVPYPCHPGHATAYAAGVGRLW